MENTFGRGHHYVVGIDGHAADMPLSALDVLLHLLELCRVVFLHPHILDGTFVVEMEVGILVHEGHIVHQSILDVLRDGGLHIPVPLRVEVGVGDEEKRLLVLCLAESNEAKHHCYRNTTDIHTIHFLKLFMPNIMPENIYCLIGKIG